MTPDLVYLAGDQINRCPWPNEVMELIRDEAWPAIIGNHDFLVMRLESAPQDSVLHDRKRFADFWWTLSHLKPEHFVELEQLPEERLITIPGAPPTLLLHGIRHDPFTGFYPNMSDEQLATRLTNISEPFVISAHTHWPMHRIVDGHTIVNPGSVGMPYNGDPRAQYLLLDLTEGSWRPTFRQVEYDHVLVREAFDRQGLFNAYGPMGPLYWQSIATGDPWVSDFLVWVREQVPIVREDLEHAVTLYLAAHGPGNWAFTSL
jgi:predicted phosphodiesterase